MTSLPWPDARAAAATAARPLPAVRLPLGDCAGLLLSCGLRARTPLPPFDTAAMDGYAVAGAGPWSLRGRVLAGDLAGTPLRPGEAVEIATGAAVPEGTHAVLPVEHAERTGDRIGGDVVAGRHVRRRGEECGAGDALLPAGTVASPPVLGLAAASGHDALDVVPRPRVAALVTGSELLREGLPRGGRVRDALGPQLPALVTAYGGVLVDLALVVDDRAELARRLAEADADVVVTTGASSVGPADHLRPVLLAAGAQVLVDGVACRPGHPQLLARLPDGRLVVGLPGNPLAALVGAATLLGPVLAGLAGRPLPAPVPVVLAEPLDAAPTATRLVPARLADDGAHPLPHTGAAMLRGAALADVLLVVPPATPLAAGAPAGCLPLSGGPPTL